MMFPMRRKRRNPDWRVFARADAKGAQACLPFRDATAILRDVSRDHFGGRFDDVTWQFSRQRSLAKIQLSTRHVRIHNALNADDVPDDVFRMIAIHEMLHLEIPPGTDARGLPEPHTEEFVAAERSRNPYLRDGWIWLSQQLPLKNRPQFKCTEVVPKVYRLTPQQRLWVRDQLGVLPPKALRPDDPAHRAQDPRLWVTMMLAYHLHGPEPPEFP